MLNRHLLPRSGAGAFQARQGRADGAEHDRFQISPMLWLYVAPVHSTRPLKNHMVGAEGLEPSITTFQTWDARRCTTPR